MGLFDFFKKKKVVKSFEDTISFRLENPDRSTLLKCKVGDNVNLWTKEDIDSVNIYSASSTGGSGLLGITPNKYLRKIKNHLLNQKEFGFSGPSTNNYEAIISEISASNCIISVNLLSPADHEIKILKMIEDEKIQIKEDLEKVYKMTKSVKIIFDLKTKNQNEWRIPRLKILEKKYYLENPYDYKIQLIDENDHLIGETYSQKNKIFRIIKAHFNDQLLLIKDFKKTEDKIIVEVEPAKV